MQFGTEGGRLGDAACDKDVVTTIGIDGIRLGMGITLLPKDLTLGVKLDDEAALANGSVSKLPTADSLARDGGAVVRIAGADRNKMVVSIDGDVPDMAAVDIAAVIAATVIDRANAMGPGRCCEACTPSHK